MSDTGLRSDEHDDRVVAILDRPATRNAIDQAMVDALHEVCARLEQTPKTLILTGAGVSAESGLATFRGADGLWEGHRVERY